jgi:hypothetical protein
MAARSPRRSFAAPFVVTLAAAPAACYVQTAPAPAYQPPPQQQGPQQQPPPPPVVSNPPRPQDPPPPQPQDPPPPQTTPHNDIAWTVFKNSDGSCSAAIKVECQPKATCNPPPPFKTACPADVSLDKPVTVRSQDNGATCMLEFPMPDCPKGVACNPPRPRKTECPTRK